MTLGISLLTKIEQMLLSVILWIYEKILAMIDVQMKIRANAWFSLKLKMLDLENEMDELRNARETYKKHIENLKM